MQMKRLLREWKHYLAEEEKMSSEQEEINVSAQQIENLLDGYVDQEDIQKVYDFVRYFYAKRKIKELNAAYQRLEGESLADSINGITGLENYKKQILKYLGGKFEATILLDEINYIDPKQEPDENGYFYFNSIGVYNYSFFNWILFFSETYCSLN